MSDLPRAIICRCEQAGLIPEPVVARHLAELSEAGVVVEVVPDLCAAAARRDARLRELAADGLGRVFACNGRAVRSLFAFADAPLGPGVAVVNLRADAPVSGFPAPDPVAGSSPATGCCGSLPKPWLAWFPVIDFERCTHCLQCLNFCLFGVYVADAGGAIRVANPEQCKPNCPACARVCPSSAILFPKHPDGTINGAEEPGSAGDKAKIDISALLGGNIYGVLRDRSGGGSDRFDAARDRGRALAERQKHLALLGEQLSIPPEVLRALGSPDETGADAGPDERPPGATGNSSRA